MNDISPALLPQRIECIAPGRYRISSESISARLIRAYLRTLRAKRLMETAERFAKVIKKQRKTGDAKPPRALSNRFKINCKAMFGSKVYMIEPRDRSCARTLIYIHGGGYVGNLAPLQWKIVEGLLARLDMRVIVPCYPLAPETDWNAGYKLIGTLYEWVIARQSSTEVLICGDSAGAGLALGYAQKLVETRRPMPSGLILFSPWLDLRTNNEEQEAFDARDPLLGLPGLRWAAMKWAGHTELDNPRLSPIFGSLAGLPPMFVASGTADLLHPDSRALVTKAEQECAELTYLEGEDMTHGWALSPIPEAKALFDLCALFVKRKLV